MYIMISLLTISVYNLPVRDVVLTLNTYTNHTKRQFNEWNNIRKNHAHVLCIFLKFRKQLDNYNINNNISSSSHYRYNPDY